MARQRRLTDKFIETAGPGFYGDGRGGHGLQLRVHKCRSGHLTRSWRQKVRLPGGQTWLGLGSADFITLPEARALALENKAAILRGQDPRNRRPQIPKHLESDPVEAAPSVPSFQEAALAKIELDSKEWKPGSPTEAAWRRSVLGTPFARRPVNEVSVKDVQEFISKRWTKTPAAAAATLRRVGQVLRWAAHLGATDVTPVVRNGLPRHRKNGVKSHAAVPVADAPDAFRKLTTCTKSRELSRLLIRFSALCASRPGEAARATWEQIEGDMWSIEGADMKEGLPHRVPLSGAALEVLDRARQLAGSDGLIFPSTTGKAIGPSSMARTLAACGVTRATPHGWRATFKSWATERREDWATVEAALAHKVKGVARAYLRSDLIASRRQLMEEWAAFLIDGACRKL